MTPQERELVLSLVVGPSMEVKCSPKEFLGRFGTADGQGLGLSLLCDAVERRDAVDVEMALIVCYTFGITMDHLGPLLQLSSADWHVKHEDVVTALGRLRTPDAVEALYGATQWVPPYLDFDESRALAVKAMWALGGTSGEEAERALMRLLDSDDEIVREGARRQLGRQNKT